MKIILPLIILLLLIIDIEACSCPPPIMGMDKRITKEIEYSQCIFIGEVINLNESNNTFEIKVIESLDGGDEVNNTYIGKNWKYCFPNVTSKGKWIIYGNIKDGFLRLRMCGISRSFEHPENGYFPPSPPIDYDSYTESELKKIEVERKKEDKKRAKVELKNEIIALRLRRNDK